MRKLFFIPVILIAASGLGRADVFYDDLAAWEAAVGSNTSVNFEASVAPGEVSPVGAGTTVGGINFAVGPSSDGLLFLLGDNTYYSTAVISSQQSDTAVNELVIGLPAPVTALGFTFGDFYGDTATVTLSDGSVAYPTAYALVVNPSLGFFGVTDSAGITSVDISTPDQALNVGAVYTEVSVTPEPGYFAVAGLLLAGMAGMRFLRRRPRDVRN